MKVVIIEDEGLAAKDLSSAILQAEPGASIKGILSSVKEAISYFRVNELPDLIFSDIQLGDGLSFEIFQSVKFNVPVIFCTAYDEYALHAFKANGIDYILKPFTRKSIKETLQRYENLQQNFVAKDYQAIADQFKSRATAADSILIYFKDKILPVKTADIALFFIKNEVVQFVTFDKKIHTVNKSLEELEQLLGAGFFRVNRKFIVNRTAIKDVSQHFHRKLLINLSIIFPTDDPITVNKVKAPSFLEWLTAR
jgi:two-component system, LytTR family, response regulator LytT